MDERAVLVAENLDLDVARADEELAAIGAALDAALSAAAAPDSATLSTANGGVPSGWRAQARLEGVRGR